MNIDKVLLAVTEDLLYQKGGSVSRILDELDAWYMTPDKVWQLSTDMWWMNTGASDKETIATVSARRAVINYITKRTGPIYRSGSTIKIMKGWQTWHDNYYRFPPYTFTTKYEGCLATIDRWMLPHSDFLLFRVTPVDDKSTGLDVPFIYAKVVKF